MPEPDLAPGIDSPRPRLRPYGATAALLRAIVPALHAAAPAMTGRHALTLLTVAPELAEVLPVPARLANALALSREGNSRLYTRRLAHGLAEFLLEALALGAQPLPGPDGADPLDREFLEVLRERAGEAIGRFGTGSSAAAPEAPAEDLDTLRRDAEECMRRGFYAASLDAAERGLERIGRVPGHPAFGALERNALFALLMLGRFPEVEERCRRVEAATAEPALRSHAAYAMAILHARLLPPQQRDLAAARAWIGKAIAFAEALPDSETKVVNLVFLSNTLALVEMRTGNQGEALRLLGLGLRRLAAEAPGKYGSESVILWHNQARLHAAAGELQAALDDYAALLALEPTNSEAHLDRALLLHGAGRLDEALAHCDEAIAWSPPYPEPFFARAVVLRALGRANEAVGECDHVLALDPSHAAARVNRAGIRHELGERDAARADADRLLADDPANAKAWSLLGLFAMEERRWPEARAALETAIAADPEEPSARVNRATLLVREGDLDGALRELDAVIARHPDPAAIANRERVVGALGRR